MGFDSESEDDRGVPYPSVVGDISLSSESTFSNSVPQNFLFEGVHGMAPPHIVGSPRNIHGNSFFPKDIDLKVDLSISALTNQERTHMPDCDLSNDLACVPSDA